jgi:ABC-type amino acid transport substrate-binding protein
MRKKDDELKTLFNHFLQEWKKNGGYSHTLKKYFESQNWVALLDN